MTAQMATLSKSNQIKYLHDLEGLEDHCCNLAQNREVAASSEFLYYFQIQLCYYTILLILRSPVHKCMATHKHLVTATKKSKPLLNICYTLGQILYRFFSLFFSSKRIAVCII